MAGFTLIEVMVTVAIVAILAAIAYPAYSEYVVRGRLVDATNALASLHAQMEQYFQDNRTYAAKGSFSPPCAAAQAVGTFSVACASAPTSGAYTITALGSGVTNGFVFSIDQDGTRRTVSVSPSWGGVPDGGYPCWVVRRNGCL
jgi:type IV pilus assembly protein PilE